MRVVSLLPAATEIVAALGVEPVGVSHECDRPPSVADVPAVTSTGVDADASPAEIDDQVAAAAAGDGVYRIDRELLASLDPDVVVAQDVCEVCAVDRVLVEDVVADLGLEARVVPTDVHCLADLWEAIRTIGRAVDRPARAAELVAELRRRVEAVAAEVGGDRAGVADGPTVAVLDWLDPPMVAGHWIPEVVGLAGGRYDLASVGDPSRPREWAAIRDRDPAVLVAAPCGFDVEQTRAHLDALADRPGWTDLTAVRSDRAWIVDGDGLVNRPGPRLVETLEVLAGIVSPDRAAAPPAALATRIEPAASGR